MAITKEELGRRLRAAREASRMTQDQVAELLGVSRPTVTQIEAGHREVTSIELDKLAYLFGRDIREFVAGEFEEQNPLTALFRAQEPADSHAEVLNRLRECMALGREIGNLERLLGIDRNTTGVASYRVRMPATRWDAVVQGERAAEEERRRLGMGAAPVPNMVELLETQGVRTAVLDLPEDVSGLMVNDKGTHLFVVANKSHHFLRRRFSFAHEYGHVLMDRDLLGMVSQTSKRDDLLEVRANAFAACLLMPEAGVLRFVADLGKGKPSRYQGKVYDEKESLAVAGRSKPGSQAIQLYDVVQLAHHFGVSVSATLYRLRNLRLLTEAEFDRLWEMDKGGRSRELSKKLGLPEPDHARFREEFKHRFLGLALDAYRLEEISNAKFKELTGMLGVSARDADRLVEESGLDDG